jgi:hypothetical protein
VVDAHNGRGAAKQLFELPTRERMALPVLPGRNGGRISLGSTDGVAE